MYINFAIVLLISTVSSQVIKIKYTIFNYFKLYLLQILPNELKHNLAGLDRYIRTSWIRIPVKLKSVTDLCM